MGDEAVNSRDLLRSFTAGVLLFALTLVGMAEMTGFETTIMGVQVGGHLRGGSIRMRVSEAKQIQTGTSPSARQSIQQVQDAVGSAQQSAQTAVTSVTTDPTVTTEPMVSGVVGGTSGAPPVDTSPQDPVVTGVVGGGSAGGTGPDTIEISARVINAQLSYQQATATAEPVPASLGDFEFARRDDTKFSVVA